MHVKIATTVRVNSPDEENDLELIKIWCTRQIRKQERSEELIEWVKIYQKYDNQFK